MDKVVNDSLNLKRDVEKVGSKGYPVQTLDFFTKKIEDLMEMQSSAQATYASHVTQSDKAADIDNLRTSTREIEASTKALDDAFLAFKKTTGKELKQLAA